MNIIKFYIIIFVSLLLPAVSFSQSAVDPGIAPDVTQDSTTGISALIPTRLNNQKAVLINNDVIFESNEILNHQAIEIDSVYNVFDPKTVETDDGRLNAYTGVNTQSIGGYNVYYGLLHSHTDVSDGSGSPEQAFEYARDMGGLDFFGISDHDYWPDDMTDNDWNKIKNAANAYNDDGTFVTFWGFEWTSDSEEWQPNGLALGHLTIVNSDDYCISTYEPTRTLNQIVDWMSTRDLVAFFNHPGQYETTFDKFNFNYTDKIVGMELWNRSDDYYSGNGYYKNDGGLGYYDEAISRGWYIGATGGQDNHDKSWGTMNEWRMAVLAQEKTRESIYAAMKARRFYSARDKNLALSFKCNESQMGSKIEGGSLNFQIEAFDGDNEEFSRIELLKNGLVIKTWTPNHTNPSVSYSSDGNDGDYFYVRVYQSDAWEAISSPVFISGGDVSNNPPVVTITEPADRSAFMPGESITFTATAMDAEEGDICAGIEWSSDHDGSFGSGCTFTTSSLSENAHLITASVTDSSGDLNSDQITVVVGEQVILENLVLPATGGVLQSFTSEYGQGWVASDLTNGVTEEDGWSSEVNPGPQEFVYSFHNGLSMLLNEAVIHAGTAEGTYFSKDVEVWISADGINFAKAASGTLMNVENNSLSFNLGETAARKVKLIITSGYRDDYWEIGEFEVFGVMSITSSEDLASHPSDYVLMQNYPNPFNPSTTINYDIAERAHVTIKVYDVLGKLVATLQDRLLPAGSFSVEFDAASLPSGIYILQLQAGHFSSLKKMMLVK